MSEWLQSKVLVNEASGYLRGYEAARQEQCDTLVAEVEEWLASDAR